jgi:hypothetical protein
VIHALLELAITEGNLPDIPSTYSRNVLLAVIDEAALFIASADNPPAARDPGRHRRRSSAGRPEDNVVAGVQAGPRKLISDIVCPTLGTGPDTVTGPTWHHGGPGTSAGRRS